MAGRDARRARRGRAPGQHFLRSPRLAAALVREAGVGPGDLVVEPGAGTGRLTAELARAGADVQAIELDAALAETLRRRFAGLPNVTVVLDDAVSRRLPLRPFRVVANLPFLHTTPILRRLLDDPRVPLLRADVIVEWNVARKRATSWPSTLLGAYWGAWYEFALVRRLPAACFEPKPKVDAALLRIMRRERALVSTADHTRYLAFLRTAFDAPLVRRTLAGPALKRAAHELGVERDAHARDLDVHQWTALFGAVRPVR